ncbi:hypothetical protein BSKO_08305 [Bryopsis sp. KO-2023]|nr:hypothetical protein BSKO_08305 [Bryopsis sp. KO-2023]
MSGSQDASEGQRRVREALIQHGGRPVLSLEGASRETAAGDMEGIARDKRRAADAPAADGGSLPGTPRPRSRSGLCLDDEDVAFLQSNVSTRPLNGEYLRESLVGIQKVLVSLVRGIANLERLTSQVNECVTDLNQLRHTTDSRFQALEARLDKLEQSPPDAGSTEEVKRAIGTLDDRLSSLADEVAKQSKRKNLIFAGIEEGPGERGPALRESIKTLLDNLQRELQDETAVTTDSWSSQVSFVSRLGSSTSGRARMVLVRFKLDLAAERLWESRRDIKMLVQSGHGLPSGLVVRRDLTQRQLQLRRELMPVHHLAWDESRKANSRISRAFFAEEKLFVVPVSGAPLPVGLLAQDTRWRSLFMDQSALNDLVYGPVRARHSAPAPASSMPPPGVL